MGEGKEVGRPRRGELAHEEEEVGGSCRDGSREDKQERKEWEEGHENKEERGSCTRQRALRGGSVRLRVSKSVHHTGVQRHAPRGHEE